MRKEKFNLLDAVPVKGTQIETTWKDGRAVLVFPRLRVPWLYSLFKGRKMAMVHVELEEHGSAVWQLIDGERTVGTIIELLADHFEHVAGYETRVSTYFMRMQKDGLIILKGRR